MHDVAALLATAAVAAVVARGLRISLIPVLLLGGVGLSALHGPPSGFLEDALILGVSFVLFVAGLELDPARVRAQRRAAVRVGAVQFAALALLGWLVADWIGFGPVEAVWVALALPASSTLVSVRILQRRRQLFEPFGRLTVGALLFQDGLILLAIPLVTGLAGGWGEVGVHAAGVLLLGAASLGVRRWVAPLLLRAPDEPETILLVSLSLLFVFLGAAGVLGLPIPVGAFLAGVALSGFPVNGIVRAEVLPIGDFFVAIFFTSLGALIRLPTGTEIVQAAVLAAVVIVVTPPLVAWVAQRAGLSSTAAIESGLLLAQTSEISLAVVLAGRIEGQVSESLFVVIALVTLTTMLLTPLIATDEVARRIAHLLPARRRARRAEASAVESATPPSDHVLLLGAGSSGMPLIEDLLLSGHPLAVIDDDPAVIGRLAEAGITAVRGDASDPAVLRAAGADRARAIASSIRRPRDNAALLEMAGGRPVLIRVFEVEDADWVRARGGEPILFAEATADTLMEWWETEGRMEAPR